MHRRTRGFPDRANPFSAAPRSFHIGKKTWVAHAEWLAEQGLQGNVGTREGGSATEAAGSSSVAVPRFNSFDALLRADNSQ
jgi:hypothetical protein